MTGPRMPSAAAPGPGVVRLLRWASVAGLLAVVVDATLLATGVIRWPIALALLLAVEVPLLIVAAVLHVLVYRRARGAGADRGDGWDALLTVNPVLRLVQVETGHVVGLPRDLWTVARGRHRGPDRFGYASGTHAMPVCLTVLLALETAVVHLVVPWPWLRLVLLVLNLYAVLLVCSVLVGRVAHPHRIVGEVLHLQFGRHTVAEVPVSTLTGEILPRREHTWLAVDGSDDGEGPVVLHLANQFGTNVRLVPAQPVSIRVPRTLGPDQRHTMTELHLVADAPQALLAALQRARQDARLSWAGSPGDQESG